MTPTDEDLLARFGVDASEIDFLLWFFCEADFGPADEDVKSGLIDLYKRKTGRDLSVRIDWRKEQ